jgi:hypothetical protein
MEIKMLSNTYLPFKVPPEVDLRQNKIIFHYDKITFFRDLFFESPSKIKTIKKVKKIGGSIENQ